MSGAGDLGGVSRMRSVYKANPHVPYIRSVCGASEVTSVRNEAKMNNKFKVPEFLIPFIETYRKMRNLWEVRHPQYYIKLVRKSTLERLLSFVQTFIPEATMEILEKKIGILRNMYRREHNKIQTSLRSGASADDVYVPRLWYFDKLRFLDDQIEARESLLTLPSTLPSTIPSTLPCTLPSTPAEADEDQPGTSILEEPDATIWSQVYYF
ncbi:hypothetical protein AB205_0101990 [Aquarana catesbeiana]|uniref:MADF domain-containing protein n=1 Tax=Aquarana catesbeiana TaxID=8400 RepID=A0A2G9Q751_AQUCT|nr:hypothetical protein AB205_0101990 [Aquarana catesbeiana]